MADGCNNGSRRTRNGVQYLVVQRRRLVIERGPL
jgi:hypothetical protein